MHKQTTYMSRSLSSLNNYIALEGIEILAYRNSSCSIFVFLKDKFLEFQCHFKQDKLQLRPPHIIYVNYLDLDQTYATHEFQVYSKSLRQNNFIRNSVEFKAKN
jgi:hypothetical protein